MMSETIYIIGQKKEIEHFNRGWTDVACCLLEGIKTKKFI
jgi:hypothetical protein